jgi:ATP-dependent Clp protease protease subunit
MRVAMQETERINKVLMELLAKNCGKTYDEIMEATVRDYWMDENDAVKFGIVDNILGK